MLRHIYTLMFALASGRYAWVVLQGPVSNTALLELVSFGIAVVLFGIAVLLFDQLKKYDTLCRERDLWRANHDAQVKINRIMRDRPDLGDRAARMQELISLLTEARTHLADHPELIDRINKLIP
jgi:hypothetical protein